MWTPLRFVGPVRCRQLAFGNVVGVAGLECFVAGRALGRTFDTLLTKANHLLLAVGARLDDVALGGVVGRGARGIARHLALDQALAHGLP